MVLFKAQRIYTREILAIKNIYASFFVGARGGGAPRICGGRQPPRCYAGRNIKI